ncbi:hypothetical protein AMAG_03919 [Allomyces macrogynus ATCC 38327]|uniref:Uncharacterized protein n=1 Tax=Allomyces macrogynus (strain ATCC 38327) TaxID=578462 RepID=A0A0L0S7K1_ALLM3|nr:hypothetical protein AMAG_03919 [Allomyces macrogynus ATCC 38327]|eukprot:KNE58334.1 hypothetical protein AMAG_03919 [Allomyces macrogynus ATCC 38327]
MLHAVAHRPLARRPSTTSTTTASAAARPLTPPARRSLTSAPAVLLASVHALPTAPPIAATRTVEAPEDDVQSIAAPSTTAATAGLACQWLVGACCHDWRDSTADVPRPDPHACARRFNSAAALLKHLVEAHAGSPSVSSTNVCGYCHWAGCTKVFKTQSKFARKDHFRAHLAELTAAEATAAARCRDCGAHNPVAVVENDDAASDRLSAADSAAPSAASYLAPTAATTTARDPPAAPKVSAATAKSLARRASSASLASGAGAPLRRTGSLAANAAANRRSLHLPERSFTLPTPRRASTPTPSKRVPSPPASSAAGPPPSLDLPDLPPPLEPELLFADTNERVAAWVRHDAALAAAGADGGPVDPDPTESSPLESMRALAKDVHTVERSLAAEYGPPPRKPPKLTMVTTVLNIVPAEPDVVDDSDAVDKVKDAANDVARTLAALRPLTARRRKLMLATALRRPRSAGAVTPPLPGGRAATLRPLRSIARLNLTPPPPTSAPRVDPWTGPSDDPLTWAAAIPLPRSTSSAAASDPGHARGRPASIASLSSHGSTDWASVAAHVAHRVDASVLAFQDELGSLRPPADMVAAVHTAVEAMRATAPAGTTVEDAPLTAARGPTSALSQQLGARSATPLSPMRVESDTSPPPGRHTPPPPRAMPLTMSPPDTLASLPSTSRILPRGTSPVHPPPHRTFSDPSLRTQSPVLARPHSLRSRSRARPLSLVAASPAGTSMAAALDLPSVRASAVASVSSELALASAPTTPVTAAHPRLRSRESSVVVESTSNSGAPRTVDPWLVSSSPMGELQVATAPTATQPPTAPASRSATPGLFLMDPCASRPGTPPASAPPVPPLLAPVPRRATVPAHSPLVPAEPQAAVAPAAEGEPAPAHAPHRATGSRRASAASSSSASAAAAAATASPVRAPTAARSPSPPRVPSPPRAGMWASVRRVFRREKSVTAPAPPAMAAVVDAAVKAAAAGKPVATVTARRNEEEDDAVVPVTTGVSPREPREALRER